ncbi:putative RNA polymerase [Kolpuevirus frurule]|uniref:RNA polymerase n=1 Tax=Kolpuevirus sp. 'frurule' TaxID=3028514 RepID=A0AAF0DP52_9CAUD|nr:putative RNA polymerase [Kolpuevirus sp. 'frurule']
MSKTCYTPEKGLDDVIASKVTGWNKHLVANLRGLYQERNPEAETPTAETLIEFRRSLSKEDSKRLLDAINSPAVSYTQLRDDFNAEERFNRISMISTMFSDIVDAVQEEYPSVSRKDIIAGFTIDGQQAGGVAGIFNEIYDTLQSQYSDAIEENDTETAAKYQKVFDNWGALISFAKIRIRDAEDLKLGQDINFADDSNPNNFNENDMTEKFVMEESKREGWMEQAEFESSFGSVGKQVRKVIGRVPVYKDGEVVLDDLGFPVMQDPVRMHQELLDVLRGVGSETEMMNALREYSSTSGWVTPFMQELENPQIRTQFYTDFKKNFQPYSMQTEKQEGRIRTYKTTLLNRIKGNAPFSSFLTSVKLGKVVNPRNSIFEKSGIGTRVMPIRLERIKNKIVDTLAEPERINEKSKFWMMSKLERKQFLIDATESLGIDIDGETLDRIMSRNRDIRALNKELLGAAKFGLNLTKEEQEGKKEVSYEELIKRASSNEKKGVLREKITKVLAIVAKSREGLKLESRVRYGDNTFFSNVIPSFMGDRFDKIASFVKATDKKGLQAMLETTYLNSSYFQYDGKILNKWLEELYNSDLSTEDNFAANFTFKRFLGTDKLKFEDFTSKQHIVQMLNEYFSEKQISPNSQYAWYPVFILGDSGVAKFIKAKRYGGQEILDGMYNVYIQEKRRMELAKAANKKMQDQGLKAIDNFSKNTDKFSLLSFLNEPKYAGMIKESNIEQTVKQAIRAYMDDSVTKFKQQLNTLGVLEQQNNQYVYLSQEVKGNRTIDQVLSDYYWNTKFATIQQLQMMTIDPSFYKGTKDLQKRYKEIHAPGTALSVEAINPFTGERYSNDGIERCVYFDDIVVDAEKTNPEFMQAVASHFGKDSDVYKSYKRNVLADGQGYRTLESYKKVMGMAGKWNERMEATYNQIQSLRAKIGRDENPSMEDIKAISDLAVTFQPIKPYMFTFENYSLGTDMLKIPVQHKYAEAVLIPELLPAGSMMRDIAYWMEDHVNPETGKSEPIDMIGAWSTGGDKIVKVGGFGSTNISNTDSKTINDALNNGYVHQLSYADYRIQTNVPEHINSSQLFGTQVRKLIMAKVQKFKDYSSYIGGKRVNLGGNYGNVKLNGGNLVRFYNSLITANILDSYHLFENSVSDANKISNRLIQTTANNSRESKDNMMAYALNERGEFTVPLFEGGLEHDSSALFFSLFKKMVNKQSIKGGSAVQVSAMGITGYEEDGGLRYVADPNNPNNILYAECEIPWDLTYTDSTGREQSLDFETYCNEDGTLKVDKDGNTILEKTYPNILSLLAYRIPTERDYSMINLRVKRFSHKTAGGTIKVPPQGTTIAGFDFDIDKLYFMRNEYQQRQFTSEEIKNIWSEFYDTYPNLKAVLQEAREEDTESLDRLYKYWEKAGLPYSYQAAFNQFVANRGYIKFEEYDFSKTPLENTKAARNNMLIHLVQQRLSDVETFKDRYTPGGFANASKAARVMRELMFGKAEVNHQDKTVNLSSINKAIDEGSLTDPEPNYDPSDPMTIVIYNQQNNVAGKLIGIFANQNTNHAFASLMEQFSLKKPITFAGKSYSDLLHNDEIDTSLNVAEFLAASVDAVKDPVLNYLNLNTITADAGAMLARLGFTTEDIGLLFNQPIIKDICEYSFNNGMSDINSVIDNVLDNYEVEGELKKAIPDEDLSRERLAYNIVQAANTSKEELMKNDEFVEKQIIVADLFREILEASNDVSQFVRNTKFTASNAVGSTFGDAYAQQMKVAAYVKSFTKADALKVEMKVAQGINAPMNNEVGTLSMNDQEYMESLLENPFAYEQAMYDMNRKAEKVINKFYPYNTKAYKEAREGIAAFTRSGLLDAETINSIHSDLMVFMLSQQENSLFNGNMSINVNGVSINSYTGNITPADDVIFVFGSNPEGRHGAGAAKVAREKFGAIYGQGEGLQGNAYALPTKDLRVKENRGYRSISKEQIVNNIRKMYRTAMQNPNKKFMVGYRNAINEMSLNGYTGGEMIDMFIEAGNIPSNVFFSEEWAKSGKFGTREQVTAREYFTEIFPEGLFNILEANPTMKSMPIFQYMQFVTDEKTGKVSMNIQDIGGLAPYQKDEIKESWGDLLRNEQTAELAQSLFLYNYYKLGFTYSPMAFMNLAPTEVKLAVQVGYDYNGNPKSYVDFLNDVQKSRIGVNNQEFAKQYLLNHLDNNRLVFHPKGRNGRLISNLAFSDGVAVSSFTLDVKKLGKEGNPFLLPSEEKGVSYFRPVIVIDDIVYMCDSNDVVFNASTTGSINYYKVDALGESGKSLQYSSNSMTVSTIADTEVQEDGNTSVEPEVVNTVDTSMSTEELIKQATDLALKADNTLDKALVIEMLNKASVEDLIDTIESLKAQANNVTDQEGNKIC